MLGQVHEEPAAVRALLALSAALAGFGLCDGHASLSLAARGAALAAVVPRGSGGAHHGQAAALLEVVVVVQAEVAGHLRDKRELQDCASKFTELDSE